jgi:cobalt-zinc-cadmium resistance protein CzcA
MTSFTTVLGLTPLLLATGIGSGVQRPLAIVVTCGLSTATVLTLFVIPALYPWFASLRKDAGGNIYKMGSNI